MHDVQIPYICWHMGEIELVHFSIWSEIIPGNIYYYYYLFIFPLGRGCMSAHVIK